MAAVFCLPVDLWVEINVMQNHRVRPCEVESLAPSPSGEQEDKHVLGGIVELVDNVQAVLDLRWRCGVESVESVCGSTWLACDSGGAEVHRAPLSTLTLVLPSRRT